MGSEGFIGSYLVKYFLNLGYSVSGCDLKEISNTRYSYKKVSIFSPEFEKVFKNQEFDVCINASGSGNVAFSVADPLSDFEVNTFSVAKVLNTLIRLKTTCKYIHISSAAVYGNPKYLPVNEFDEMVPVSPYGYHKFMSELLCKEFHFFYNVPIVILRPFSVYGNGLNKQLLWDICEKINAADSITLYGTGNESRDFVHISDLCELVSIIISKSLFNGDIYNVASGVETTIRQIADIFEYSFQNKKKILFSGKSKIGDPINWKADISKINQLGFRPNVSLEKGIKDYIDWYFASF